MQGRGMLFLKGLGITSTLGLGGVIFYGFRQWQAAEKKKVIENHNTEQKKELETTDIKKGLFAWQSIEPKAFFNFSRFFNGLSAFRMYAPKFDYTFSFLTRLPLYTLKPSVAMLLIAQEEQRKLKKQALQVNLIPPNTCTTINPLPVFARFPMRDNSTMKTRVIQSTERLGNEEARRPAAIVLDASDNFKEAKTKSVIKESHRDNHQLFKSAAHHKRNEKINLNDSPQFKRGCCSIV